MKILSAKSNKNICFRLRCGIEYNFLANKAKTFTFTNEELFNELLAMVREYESKGIVEIYAPKAHKVALNEENIAKDIKTTKSKKGGK